MARAAPNTLRRTARPGAALSLADYLQKIITARVYDVADESPLDLAKNLSKRLGNQVLLKREDAQPVFSFKLRGAYNKMAHLNAEQLKRGVICASAGNHAQGVALGAKRLGCKALIVMPVTTPKLKIDAVRALGGEVVLNGESYSDAYLHAQQLQAEQGLTFVHPFDDPDVIAGQGTVAMELLRQHPGPIDAVFVAIGGGGLISGVAAYIKAVRPEIKVIGVQTTDSDAMLRSVRAGKRVQLADVGLFADGTAVKLVGVETFRLARELVDDYVVVDTDAVCAAIKDVFQDTRSILEPSGAMGVAALKQYVETHRAKGQTLVAITCGANMNFDRLRFVAERAEVGEDPRSSRQLQALLRADRPARRHRVQLPHLERETGACLRRRRNCEPRRGGQTRTQLPPPRFPDPQPERRRTRQAAPAPHGRRAQRAGEG
jgi:threonine dehydratase